MTGQQICLKWNSFQANILTSFESLWEEEGLVDVTLASDGECIRAHKVILSACSPFFKRLFQTNPCQHPVIILQDVHFTELESILSFVYKGEVNIDQGNLPALLRAAETLQIRGLSGASEQLKEKMGVPKTASSVPINQTHRDGSPPRKRRRSVQPSRSPALPTTPVASIPTSLPEYSRHPPSSSTDPDDQMIEPSEPMVVHKIEAASSESESPVPQSFSVEDGFEEHLDESSDAKATQASETEQLKDVANPLENDDSFKVGATYATFKQFEDAFKQWADAGYHPMTRLKSNRNRNPLQAEDHPFMAVQYGCKHYGLPRSRGNNIRPNQRYYSRECPVVVNVTLGLRAMRYKVKQIVEEHNHPVSAELRAQYPDRRTHLDIDTRATILELIHHDVKPSVIRSYLASNYSSTITAKDIHNFKKVIKPNTKKHCLESLGDFTSVEKNGEPSGPEPVADIGSNEDIVTLLVDEVEDNSHLDSYEPVVVYNILSSDDTDTTNPEPEFMFMRANDSSSEIPASLHYIQEDNEQSTPVRKARAKTPKVFASALSSKNTNIEHPVLRLGRVETVETESEDIVTTKRKRTINTPISKKK